MATGSGSGSSNPHSSSCERGQQFFTEYMWLTGFANCALLGILCGPPEAGTRKPSTVVDTLKIVVELS